LESDRHKSTRDRLANPALAIAEFFGQHGEEVSRYEQAGKVGRWLMRQKDPTIARHSRFAQNIRATMKTSETVQESKLSAAQDGAQIYI
jgi:hypothetical protein